MDDGRLRVETLGPLRVHAGGREFALGPPKQRAVFAVLALNVNGVVSRDDLIDHVWGESPPATAAGSLHTYVSGLRRVLAGAGGPLTSSGPGYVLRLDAELVDVRLVERLAARARASRAGRDASAAVAALDEALTCWRPGSPLGGLPGPFAAEHRARVADLRLRLLTERAELLLDLGRPDDVVGQLAGQLAAHPYHERLRALLMTALHRAGRTADALGQYQALRTLLVEDLGIDPSTELQALHASILADAAGAAVATRDVPPEPAPPAPVPPGPVPPVPVPPGPVPPVPVPPGPVPLGPAVAEPVADNTAVRPAQLPRDVGYFVGRANAVLQVLAASGGRGGSRGTAGPAPGIVMIVGVGGIGKTALAVRCGHLLSVGYPDGEIYLNLRGFDPKQREVSPSDALFHLLSSVNVGTVPADHEQRVGLWRSVVQNKRLLIVLDNAASADQVEDLLPGVGPSFVLVTSRNRLSGVAVRHSARRVTLSPLAPEESVKLLSDAIGPARARAELSTVRRVAELCDHVPLALRIAAEQVTARTQSRIADLVADLEDVQRRLDALQLPDDEELCSVRAVLSWSYARLDAAAAHAFRMLGLFPGVGIGSEAAAALLDRPRAEATAALRYLAAQHLVETAGGLWQMHDLTRIYAEEVSRGGETPASRQQALDRVLRWYVQTLTPVYRTGGVHLPFIPEADERHEPLRFGGQRELVAWCIREWANLMPLVRAARQAGRHEQAWQLVYLLFDHFYAAGQTREWVEALRVGLLSAEALQDRRAQAVLLNHLSVAYSRLGRNGDAVRQLRRGLELLSSVGDDVLRISLLGNLASTLREAKDYAAARPYALTALELARTTGLDYYEAGCLDVLCELHAELGEYEEALRYGEPALEAARRSQSMLFEVNILINIGVAEHGLGQDGPARQHLADALALSGSGGDRYHEALALFALARVEHAGADRAVAVRMAAELAGRALRRLAELDAEEAVEVTAYLAALDAELAQPASAAAANAVGAGSAVSAVGTVEGGAEPR
jgi:DNA-binding SARP family transcriptional activator/tetratricopeptide (TPR) repeat protein